MALNGARFLGLIIATCFASPVENLYAT